MKQAAMMYIVYRVLNQKIYYNMAPGKATLDLDYIFYLRTIKIFLNTFERMNMST